MKHRPPGFLNCRIDVAKINIKQHLKTVLGQVGPPMLGTLAQDLKSPVQLPTVILQESDYA